MSDYGEGMKGKSDLGRNEVAAVMDDQQGPFARADGTTQWHDQQPYTSACPPQRRSQLSYFQYLTLEKDVSYPCRSLAVVAPSAWTTAILAVQPRTVQQLNRNPCAYPLRFLRYHSRNARYRA